MRDNNWHEAQIRVRYKDTDRMGVVYYGNYLTFFEVGRAELMRDLGFPYSAFENNGYSLVVIEANARYHANVGYDCLVIVKTRLSQLTAGKVGFEYEVTDEDGKRLVTGHTVHACVNSTSKPMKIPTELREVIEPNLGS